MQIFTLKRKILIDERVTVVAKDWYDAMDIIRGDRTVFDLIEKKIVDEKISYDGEYEERSTESLITKNNGNKA